MTFRTAFLKHLQVTIYIFFDNQTHNFYYNFTLKRLQKREEIEIFLNMLQFLLFYVTKIIFPDKFVCFICFTIRYI